MTADPGGTKSELKGGGTKRGRSGPFRLRGREASSDIGGGSQRIGTDDPGH
jgi:hypothetical protein